jgi:hypothetical protein
LASLQIHDLQDETRFTRLVELSHPDLMPFLAEYYGQRRSWVIWLHYAFTALNLIGLAAVGWAAGTNFDEGMTAFGLGVLAFLVLIPIHEAIHGVVYWLAGARDIRYAVSLKQVYAYAAAHHFVADAREFFWVALSPFLLISLALLAGAALSQPLRLFLLSTLLLHTGGASGDFAMLNYLWLQRAQTLYTYDDLDTQKSYFFALRGE